MAAIGSVFAAFSVAPIVVWLVVKAMERYFPDALMSIRAWAIVAISVLTSVFFALQCYRCFCKFSPHRHTLHPAFVAPRVCLFLELHPIWGVFIPVTAMLRGFHFFAFVRWALNLSATVLLLVGDAILLPEWRRACCYGVETLAEGKEPCDSVAYTNTRGMKFCSDKSDAHIEYEKLAIAFIAVSGALQLCNVMTITWSVTAQIVRLVRETADGKFRIVGHEDETVNLHLVLRLMGMPYNIEKEVFRNAALESREETKNRIHRLHHHPHWCMPGVYRLVALDPIFGYVLSFHDFLGCTNTRGSLRVVANFVGASLLFLSVEVLQPIHYAWCW